MALKKTDEKYTMGNHHSLEDFEFMLDLENLSQDDLQESSGYDDEIFRLEGYLAIQTTLEKKELIVLKLELAKHQQIKYEKQFFDTTEDYKKWLKKERLLKRKIRYRENK